MQSPHGHALLAAAAARHIVTSLCDPLWVWAPLASGEHKVTLRSNGSAPLGIAQVEGSQMPPHGHAYPDAHPDAPTKMVHSPHPSPSAPITSLPHAIRSIRLPHLHPSPTCPPPLRPHSRSIHRHPRISNSSPVNPRWHSLLCSRCAPGTHSTTNPLHPLLLGSW